MSVTENNNTRVRSFAIPLFFRSLIKLLTVLAFCSSGTVLHAQTVQIKLVNGRNGLPMASTCVNVWVGNERKTAMVIPTNENGIALVRLTDKDGEIDTNNRWKSCGESGVIRPVVKYNDSVRINVGYVLCQFQKPDNSWLVIQDLSTKEIFQHGIVTANTCGKAVAPPEPGKVIIFVRPLSWTEKLKQ